MNMVEFSELLNINYNNISPQKGKVLISQPFMSDGCFRRAVILLTKYADDGAVGFILNKWLPIPVDAILDDFPTESTQLSIGGPVAANTLHYIHSHDGIPDAIEIIDGIYWGGKFEVVRKLLSFSILKPENIRFFLGYSGWTGGQLEHELKSDSWLVGDIVSSQIINPSRDLWKDAVRNMGDEYLSWTNLPENPALN